MGRSGVILLNVVIILLTIALIGASLVAFFSLVNISARLTADEAKAFYLAEAGIADAVSLLQSRATGIEQSVGPVELGEGTYEVEIDIIQSLIISTGRVGPAKKILQLYYSTL